MLKAETIGDLKTVFERDTELSEFGIGPEPGIEIINLDLVRIYIYDRIHPDDVGAAILEILRDNNEPGPLNVHVETATSCRLTLYADISTI